MSNDFHGPEVSKEEDEKLLQDAQPQGRIDWSEVYWKPKKDFENVIRILPGKGKATYHLKMGRHFIKHEDRTEMFFCNLETYGEECIACEKRAELLKTGDKAADFYKPDVRGVFNVVDYTDEEAKVKLWEAPPVAVWVYILNIVRGKSRYNNVVGTEENPLEGRDIVVFYDPDAQPQNMYKIQFESASVLKAASAKKWLEEAKELLAEDLYPRTEPEVARIKTFGSVEEREELRKKLAEQATGPKGEVVEAAKELVEEGKEDDIDVLKKRLAEAEAKKKAEEEKPKEKEKDEGDEVAKAEKMLADAKAKKAKEAEGKKEPEKSEEKPAEKKKETPEDVKKKVDEIRKKHQAS